MQAFTYSLVNPFGNSQSHLSVRLATGRALLTDTTYPLDHCQVGAASLELVALLSSTLGAVQVCEPRVFTEDYISIYNNASRTPQALLLETFVDPTSTAGDWTALKAELQALRQSLAATPLTTSCRL
jgi:hypothetical protein